MPKRSSDKEQEVLGQIFDFIFKQAKQKPVKIKPIKPTGLNGKNMLTDGLVAALERPGVFLTEQAIKDFNDSLDLTFLKLKPDQAGPMSVKVSSNTLIDIFKDPMKFMQGTIDKAKPARLEAKATFIGPIMREFVSNAWARKYADLDTQQAVRLGLASQIVDPRKKKLELERDKWNMQAALAGSSGGRGNTFGESKGEQLTYMQERASTLIARATFGEREWNTMAEDDKEDILKIFALGEKNDPNDYKTELQGILAAKGYNQVQQNTLADRFADTMTRNKATGGVPGENGISLSNANFYRNLEISNLDNRITDLQRGGHGLSVDETNRQIESFQKAKILIAAQDLDAGRINAANAQLRSWIQQTKNDIRTETDPNRKAQLKSKLRELRGDSRQLDTISFWGTVGTFEGYWGSLNHLVGEGAFVTDILNGDLFDSNKTDALRPSEGSKSDLGIVFFVPRTDGKNQLINTYNKALTQVYYFTPKSIMRTIFLNGEGFAYSMFKSKNLVNDLVGANGITAADWTQLLSGNSQTVIDAILSSPGLQGLQGMKRLQLELSLKNYARMGKLHDIFSRNQRIKDAITKGIEKLLTKARAKMIKSFMSNALFRKMFSGSAGKLLGQWIAKGGIQNIARALVVGIANALGLATSGGLANIVISAAAMVVVDVLFAVGKILFGIVIFALIGFFGLMVMGGISLNNFAKKTYTYANTVPGEVIYNPNFIDDNYIITGGDPGAPGTVYTGNAQQIYEQVRKEFGLSVPLRLVTCTDGPDPDEVACGKISWAWCYSDSGEIICRADKIASARSDAGLTHLFRHELVHQIQEGDGGTKNLYHEWGADFLSSNGGGYSFTTKDGVKRAAETASYLLSSGVCTQSLLERIALGKEAGTPCSALVRSYITGYGAR